jgi:salicylate hydroxylase
VQAWHKPIPNTITLISNELCTGYPIYDQQVFNIDDFKQLQTSSSSTQDNDEITKTTTTTTTHQHKIYHKVTILSDAAHPMSPIKGQGANQAMIDASQLS